MFGGGTSCAKSMQANDYFEVKPQLALAEAAASGNTEKLKQLLVEGVQVDGRGKEGMTALIWAILQQNKKGFQYLLENGADPNIQMTDSNLAASDLTAGNSAMSFAAMHEDPWYLEIVLKHGGNPNLVNPINGLTPIFECIMRSTRSSSRLMHVKMLIAAGANLNFQGKNGETPIIAGATTSSYDLVYAMLEGGADPAIKDKWGYTVLSEIRAIHTDPASEQYKWRNKTIDFLKAKGIDVEHGQ